MKRTTTEREHYKKQGGFRVCRVVTMLILNLSFVVGSVSSQEPKLVEIDRNRNRLIEPNEIPARYKMLTARYASLAGLDMSKPLPIDTLKFGRSEYYRLLEGRDGSGTIKPSKAGERGFGIIDGKPPVQGFGLTGDKQVVATDADRQQAIGTFTSYDLNRDGFLSREEVLNTKFSKAATFWFRGDFNGDGRLNLNEMAYYFASKNERGKIDKARSKSTWIMDSVKVTLAHRQGAANLFKKLDKDGNGLLERQEIIGAWWVNGVMKLNDTNGDRRLTLEEMYRGRALSLEQNAKQNASIEKSASRQQVDRQRCRKLAVDVFNRHATDKNKSMLRRWNGEWRKLGKDMESADTNNDGYIIKDELANWFYTRLYPQPGANLPGELPVWFLEHDVDGDGQILFSEYHSANSKSANDLFKDYDHNNDGIITAKESTSRSAGGKTRFAGTQPLMIEAGKEGTAELFIADDITIADLDVYVTIAKNGDDDLELRLIGPSGQTAVLYYDARSKPWGGGRLFDNTYFDDEAPEIRQRLPRPPAHRSFRPQGMTNRDMASLSTFYGKPARGTWRLVIRNDKSGVAGLLQGWALYVKAAKKK